MQPDAELACEGERGFAVAASGFGVDGDGDGGRRPGRSIGGGNGDGDGGRAFTALTAGGVAFMQVGAAQADAAFVGTSGADAAFAGTATAGGGGGSRAFAFRTRISASDARLLGRVAGAGGVAAGRARCTGVAGAALVSTGGATGARFFMRPFVFAMRCQPRAVPTCGSKP